MHKCEAWWHSWGERRRRRHWKQQIRRKSCTPVAPCYFVEVLCGKAGKKLKSLHWITFPIKMHPLCLRRLTHLRNLHIFKGTRSVGYTSYWYTICKRNIFKLDTFTHVEALQQRPKVTDIICLILQLRSFRAVSGVSHESLVDATIRAGVHDPSSSTSTSPFLLSLLAWLYRYVPTPGIALDVLEDTRRKWKR